MVIGCPYCAAIQEMPALPRRGQLACRICHSVLERRTGRSLDAALACGTAALLLLFPANLLPLLTAVAPGGATARIHLASGCTTIWGQGYPLVAMLCIMMGVVLPFLRFGVLVASLAALRLGRQDRWIGPAFRFADRLDIWAMPDVLLAGSVIGYGRVASYIPVQIGPGGYCFVGAALLAMLTRASLDRRAVWRRIAPPGDAPGPDPIACVACDLVLPAAMEGRRCPRCAARLHRRMPASLSRVTALVLTGALLLPLAYYFPASALVELGVQYPHTIADGIALLFQHGYWPVGVLICCTSIGIPFGKLIGLGWFCLSVECGSKRWLHFRTSLYRVIDEIGRWSNLDPFTVVIFTPMVQFPGMAFIQVRGGAPIFMIVVVLSMVAARLFDPRLMWDAAGYGRAAAGTERVSEYAAEPLGNRP